MARVENPHGSWFDQAVSQKILLFFERLQTGADTDQLAAYFRRFHACGVLLPIGHCAPKPFRSLMRARPFGTPCASLDAFQKERLAEPPGHGNQIEFARPTPHYP
jgi:hypothetical protein